VSQWQAFPYLSLLLLMLPSRQMTGSPGHRHSTHLILLLMTSHKYRHRYRSRLRTETCDGVPAAVKAAATLKDLMNYLLFIGLHKATTGKTPFKTSHI
jgi:hypothetical protein